jgi:Domain of unknown function (DUF4357)/GIY-YIG catalytic domain
MIRTRTIELELLSGDPSGVRTIKFTNRNIKGLVIPRKLIHEAFQEEAMGRYGIYFLIWSTSETDEQNISEDKIYIWQASHLKTRIKEHNDKKDFWNTCICFTTWDNSFDSSDINFLENQLIIQSGKAWRYTLENKTKGNYENISRWRKSDIEEYIEDLEILLWTLGFPILTPLIRLNSEWKNVDVSGWEDKMYYLTRSSCKGEMIYTNEWFIVLKWSTGKSMENSWIRDWIHTRREKLEKDGVIQIIEDGKVVFIKDHLFKSPSWGAMILSWSASNGWWDWKDINGKSLWENENHWS